jgi:ABC-type Fe3+ transport system permease subunit
MIYVYIAGGDAVQQATAIVGWLSLIAGLALVGMAFMRRSQQERVDELVESAERAAEQRNGEEVSDTGVIRSPEN